MALTDDQKAILRLLAQREQGYDDIAALTGQGVDGVRAKVKEALLALEGSGAPAEDQKAILRLLAQREEGYGDIAALSGQGIEEVRGKVRQALAALEGATTPAEPPSPPERRQGAAQEAQPEPESAAAIATPRPRAADARASRLRVPEDRGAVLGLGAGLAVVLLLVILIATGALGGGGESNSGTEAQSEAPLAAAEGTKGGSGEAPSESSPASGEGSKSSLKPTQAILKPVNGSQASGRALFAKTKKQVVLLVRAKGLQAAPKGQSYTISLAKSSSEQLPLVATQVNKRGEVVGTFPVAPEVLGLLASGFDQMELSLVANGELNSALKAARQAKAAPNYKGTAILRGPVTGAIVEAGKTGKVKP